MLVGEVMELESLAAITRSLLRQVRVMSTRSKTRDGYQRSMNFIGHGIVNRDQSGLGVLL